jgi:hypothetical protein
MADYLQARAEHAARAAEALTRFPRAGNSELPSIIEPIDLLVLQLERQRRAGRSQAALWLAGAGQHTLAPDDIAALVADHFGTYQRQLGMLLDACEQDPGFGEALFWAARLALKLGFEAGHDLLAAAEPHLHESPELSRYQRERRELEGGEDLPEPVRPGGKQLRILE